MVGAIRDRYSDTFDSFPACPGGIEREAIKLTCDTQKQAFWTGRCSAGREPVAQQRICERRLILNASHAAGFAIYVQANLAIE